MNSILVGGYEPSIYKVTYSNEGNFLTKEAIINIYGTSYFNYNQKNLYTLCTIGNQGMQACYNFESKKTNYYNATTKPASHTMVYQDYIGFSYYHLGYSVLYKHDLENECKRFYGNKPHMMHIHEDKLYIVFLEDDKVEIYQLSSLEKIDTIYFPRNAGPRHLYCIQDCVYIVSELSNCLFRYQNKQLDYISLATWGRSSAIKKMNNFICVSTRDNNLFSVIDTHSFSLVYQVECPKGIRDFYVDDKNNLIIMASEEQHTLTSYHFENQQLNFIDCIDIQKPTCIQNGNII